MSTDQWQMFLQRWSDDWLSRGAKFPPRVIENRWLGNKPATEKQLAKAEQRLGYRLPPSYRNFLLTTDGWSRTCEMIQRIRPIRQVDLLEDDNPQMLDSWPEGDPSGDDELKDYFSYHGRPIFDSAYFRESLIIADPVDGDSMMYLLNPKVVAPDGEWEACRFAHWIPGAERFPSFALLMRAEYQSFCGEQSPYGPYEGVYAPDQPRHEAERAAVGKTKARRRTIPELIVQLEDVDKAVRLAAAKQLFYANPMYEIGDHPEIVEPLSRVLSSSLETVDRAAAASVLGGFAGSNAIPPLIAALNDPDVAASAIGALFNLCVKVKDPRIADSVWLLLEKDQDYFIIDNALNILDTLNDPRIAELGLKLLDGTTRMKMPQQKRKGRGKSSSGAEVQNAVDHVSMRLRFAGAFAFAKFGEKPTEQLLIRLTHPHAGIRAAAVAALRQIKGKGHQLISAVEPLLAEDPDEAVRMQASMTLNFLKPRPPIELSSDQISQAEEQVAQFIRWIPKGKSQF